MSSSTTLFWRLPVIERSRAKMQRWTSTSRRKASAIFMQMTWPKDLLQSIQNLSLRQSLQVLMVLLSVRLRKFLKTYSRVSRSSATSTTRPGLQKQRLVYQLRMCQHWCWKMRCPLTSQREKPSQQKKCSPSMHLRCATKQNYPKRTVAKNVRPGNGRSNSHSKLSLFTKRRRCVSKESQWRRSSQSRTHKGRWKRWTRSSSKRERGTKQNHRPWRVVVLTRAQKSSPTYKRLYRTTTRREKTAEQQRRKASHSEEASMQPLARVAHQPNGSDSESLN